MLILLIIEDIITGFASYQRRKTLFCYIQAAVSLRSRASVYVYASTTTFRRRLMLLHASTEASRVTLAFSLAGVALFY